MTLTLASFSGGKDSTAMVVRMLELGERLDEVVFCDTGMEFPAMYAHIEKVKTYVEESGVKFTTLKGDLSFRELFIERPIESSKYGHSYHGYGWPGMYIRWCTKHFKTEVISRYLKGVEHVMCVGLASDEMKRIARPSNQKDRHPLAEWGWTEEMCLGYCYGKGYDWYDPETGKGLYELFDRTSCWLCPFGKVDYYRTLRHYYPELWLQIGNMESELRSRRIEDGMTLPVTWRYTPRRSWQEMDDRFAMEDMGILPRKLDDFFTLEASE